MSTLQFQCPQCAGPFQIDSSYAGQTVGCPNCGSGIALPPLEMLAPQGPPPGYPPGPQMPPPPMPMQPPPGPPSGPPPGAMALACPLCGGGFMIPPELAGQQVACPHCHQGVSVPGSFAPPTMQSAPHQPPPPTNVLPPTPSHSPLPPVPVPSAPRTSTPVQAANTPPPTFLYPPGFEPPGMKPTSATAPPPATPAKGDKANLYPPGMGPASQPRPFEKAPVAPAPRVEPASLYPPGMTPPSERPKPTPLTPVAPAPAPPAPAPVAPVNRPLPVAPAPRPAPIPESEGLTPADIPLPAKGGPRWKVEEMLPPGAEDLEALLPPGGTDAPQAPIRPNVPLPIPKHVPDTLLPPGVGEEVPAGALQQVALPEAEMERQLREMNRPVAPTNVPKDAVLIPTEEGSYVALREPVKTVGKGVNERELHVLPPEVKQKRRFVRTIIVYVLGLLILVVSFILLTRV